MDRDKRKEQQLHYYASKGKLAEVKSLVTEGVDINAKTQDGKTPLMLAALHSRVDIVALLIYAGADMNCRDDEKWTVLHHASKKGWFKIVHTIVDKKFDLNVKTDKGETPIMFAAQWGFKNVVKLLIDSGADISCYDDYNWSVLHHASIKGCTEIVESIVEKGVDINAKDLGGNTPLHLAVTFYGVIETVNFLLDKGADCNAEDDEGVSPFSRLIDRQTSFLIGSCPLPVGTIRLCIEKGASVTAMDYKRIVRQPLLRSSILQRKKFCSQAIINNYNNKDLPALYRMLVASDILPPIDNLKIKDKSGAVNEIKRVVARDIDKKEICNLMKVKPLVLSLLCVKSFLAYAQHAIKNSRVSFNQTNPSCSQSGLKRLSVQENPSKKICVQEPCWDGSKENTSIPLAFTPCIQPAAPSQSSCHLP